MQVPQGSPQIVDELEAEKQELPSMTVQQAVDACNAHADRAAEAMRLSASCKGPWKEAHRFAAREELVKAAAVLLRAAEETDKEQIP